MSFRIFRPFLFLLFTIIFVNIVFAAPKKGTEMRSLTLGMGLYTDPKLQTSVVQPFLDYLSEKTGTKVSLYLCKDYTEMISGIDHEAVDLAILSPVIYALCMDDPSISYLATVLDQGSPVYHSVIITTKDSQIRSLQDLSGKKIGFVDRYSASGYIYPAAFLKTSGLMNGETPLYTPVFLGNHERVVRALLENQVDAVATYDTFFDYTKNQVGDRKGVSLDTFRVLKILPERIPSDAFVCRSALGKEMLLSLKNAVKSFHGERNKLDSKLNSQIYSGFKLDNRPAYEAVKAFIGDIVKE